MQSYRFPNTGPTGYAIIWLTTEPVRRMDGTALVKGDIWVNTTTYTMVVYNGTNFTSEGETSTGVYKFSYDAAAYFTITQADGGGVTFNSVSDGTAGFSFADPVTINAASGCHLQLGASSTTALTMGAGSSSTPLSTATADKNFIAMYSKCTATSGDSRSLYVKHELNGTIAETGYGDGIRSYALVTGTNYSYASGIHATMQINASATVTGSGSGIRTTLAAAEDTRTLSGKLSALHVCSDLASGNTPPSISGFIRVTDDGAVRLSNLLVLPDAANGTLFAEHTDQTMTHSIKCITDNGTVVYLMATTTATGRS